MRGYLLVLIFCLILQQSESLQKTDDIAISHLNLLLPYTEGRTKVSFPLEGLNGCFKWLSSSTDVVTVTPISSKQNRQPLQDTRCTTMVLVTVSQHAKKQRESAWVVGEDVATGRKVRCEVFVDLIHTVEIGTTTRVIYNNDIYDIFVQGRDAVGNVFSTLEGVVFEWTVSSLTSNAVSTPLKLAPFTESSKEVSPVLLQMEQEKKKSYTTLVQGVETGLVHVTAKLIEFGYSQISTDVVISVLEPLELNPFQPVYLTPGSLIHYELQTFARNYTRVIRMPNPLYRWSVSNSSVAVVDQTGVVDALTLGKTEVLVQHQEMEDSYAKGLVFVIWPASLSLDIFPDFPSKANFTSSSFSTPHGGLIQNLIEGRPYRVVAQVRDTNGHPILQNAELHFEVEIPTSYFQITHTENHHALHNVLTRTPGRTEIRATLRYLIHARTKERIPLPHPLIAVKEVEISSPVVVYPKVVKISWDGSFHQPFTLQAHGGSGEYTWHSADPQLARANSQGFISVTGKGSTEVFAIDAKNPSNFDSCSVHIVSVAKMEILPISREIEQGDTTLVGVRFYDFNGDEFYQCNSIAHQWTVNDPEVFSVLGDVEWDELPPEYKHAMQGRPPCQIKRIQAKRAGQSIVGVSHFQIRAETTLFAFEPLQLVPSEAVVTLGSSYTFRVSGGPHPWIYDPDLFISTMTSSPAGSKQISVEKIPSIGSGKVQFRVTCLVHGDKPLFVEVRNQPTTTNRFPAVRNATAMFYCHPPAFLGVYPRMPSQGYPSDPRCGDVFWSLPSSFEPLSDRSTSTTSSTSPPTTSTTQNGGVISGNPSNNSPSGSKGGLDSYHHHSIGSSSSSSSSLNGLENKFPTEYHFRGDQKIPFQLQIQDYQGRLFHNYSSVSFEWTSTNENLAKFIPKCYNECPLQIEPQRGQTTLRVNVAPHYNATVLSQAKIYSLESIPNQSALRREISLVIYKNVELTPPKQLVYLHRENSASIHVQGGSGVIQFQSNDTSRGYIQRNESSFDIHSALGSGAETIAKVIPLQTGVVQILAEDQCLYGSTPARSLVLISEIGSIIIHVQEMIPIGGTTELKLTVFDSLGNQFDESQLRLMQLQPYQDTAHVYLQRVPNSWSTYRVEGVRQGISRVSFSSTQQSGRTITSAVKIIHVYPPFQLDPDLVELRPGVTYQTHPSGGPPSGAQVIYSSSAPHIADVDSLGIITAYRIGDAIITGISQGYDVSKEPSGELVQYGTDQVYVEVKTLGGIRIHTSTVLMVSGNEMNVYVVGANGENPFTYYGTDLTFHWESSDEEVIKLIPHHSVFGAELQEELMFSVRVAAGKSGKSRISVSVQDLHSGSHHSELHGLRASISMEVIDSLIINSPAQLLMTPDSSFKLQTSLDHLGTLTYSLLSPMEEYCSSVHQGLNLHRHHHHHHQFDHGSSDSQPNHLNSKSSSNDHDRSISSSSSSSLSACSSLICSISSTGEIRTNSRTGMCYLMIEEPHSKQRGLVSVEVKPVHMIQTRMLVSESSDATTGVTLPIGNSLGLYVRILDDLAREFHSSHAVPLQYTLNSQEILSLQEKEGGVLFPSSSSTSSSGSSFSSSSEEFTGVSRSQNYTVTLRGLYPGETILGIQAEHDGKLQDYLRFRVGTYIRPNSPVVHVGAEIHFSTFKRTQTAPPNQSLGQWKSSDPSVVAIDERNGVAVAKRTGSAVVQFIDSAQGISSTRVSVVQVDNVQLSPPEEGYFTNHLKEEYFLPVRFFAGSQELDLSVSGVVNKIPYECGIEPSEWAIARSVLIQGKPHCSVKLLSSSALVERGKLDSFPDSLEYRVQLLNSGALSVVEMLKIPFHPEFVVEGRVREIHIHVNQPRAQFQIRHGSDDPVISTSSRQSNLFRVYRVSEQYHLSTYQVDVLQLSSEFSETIVITYPLIQQLVEIRVYFHLSDGRTTTSGSRTTPGGGHQPIQPPDGSHIFFVDTDRSLSSPLYYISLVLATLLTGVLGYIYCIPHESTPAPKSKVARPSAPVPPFSRSSGQLNNFHFTSPKR